MNRVKNVVGAVAAATLLAGGSMVGFATPALAEPTITVEPNENLKAGDEITVTVTGFGANKPIAVGIGAKDRVATGPGDGGRGKNGNSDLTTSDANGSSTAKLLVPVGPLGNLTPPAVSCPPCQVNATDISSAGNPDGPIRAKSVVLNYASEAAAPKKKAAASNADAADGAAASNADSGADSLASTGPRETAVLALAAFLMLQIGVVLAVRAARSTPRRTAA
jgi:hypothetical protein